VSNYRVRQVMQLTRPRRKGPRWLARHRDFLVGLATYMSDDSLSVKCTNDQLAEASGRDRWAVNLAKRELVKDGVITYEPARHRGQVTTYRVLADLPALRKGVDPKSSPSEGVDPKSSPSVPRKGWTSPDRRGGPTIEKGVDLESTPGFNTPAKSSLAARELLSSVDPAVTDDETEMIMDILRGRGARSPLAVLKAGIANGDGGSLLAEARKRGRPTPIPPPPDEVTRKRAAVIREWQQQFGKAGGYR